jgi:hypothetical protein
LLSEVEEIVKAGATGRTVKVNVAVALPEALVAVIV